jgi:prepilin-type N-terminal cleavage/methylation domain-containing protein
MPAMRVEPGTARGGRGRRAPRRSFTLIELLASAVILSILSVMGVPYAQTAKDRQLEIDLKEALVKMRSAIELFAYNETSDEAAYPKSPDRDVIRGEDGAGDPDGDGIADDDWDGRVDEDGAPVYPVRLSDLVTRGYVSNIPRDPLSDDPMQPATWTLVFVKTSLDVRHDDGTSEKVESVGIIDAHSKNKGTGLAGTRFDTW